MRFLAIVPVVCALAALVLSFLCLFAGDKKSFLQNADIMTVSDLRLVHVAQFKH